MKVGDIITTTYAGLLQRYHKIVGFIRVTSYGNSISNKEEFLWDLEKHPIVEVDY